MSKKILLFGSFEASGSNATLIHLFSIAEAWQKMGFNVEVLIPKPCNGKLAIGVEDISFQLHQKYSARSLYLPNCLSGLINVAWIINHVRRNQINLIYSRMNVLSYISSLFLRLFTEAIIVTEHNGWLSDEIASLGKARKVSKKIFELFQIWDAKIAHFVRVVTPGIKNLLVQNKVNPERILVQGNGTQTNWFFPLPREECIQQLNLAPDLFYIGFIGNLVAWQGIDLSLRAFSIVFKSFPQARLLIVGGGSELHNLKKIATKLNMSNYVKFIGEIPVLDANKYLNVFDIAIAPFIKERNNTIGLSPLKIRDYAAAGRPVVCADILGISESTSSNWVLLHEPDCEKDLADKLIYLIMNPIVRQNMSKSAREYALSHYSWDTVAKNILSEITANIITEKGILNDF